MSLRSQEPLLPIWVQILIICICLCFSALFSGLNLGLMSLDRTDLKVISSNSLQLDFNYESPADFVQYGFRQRKGLREGHPAGARSRKLSSLQYSLRKCSRQLDIHDSPRQLDERAGCRRLLDSADRHFRRNHTSGWEINFKLPSTIA